MKLEEEQTLELIQTLTQMYKVIFSGKKIAVEYYIDSDERKADYFQKKLNNLVVRSLDIDER